MIRKATTDDIPAIRIMADIAFRNTYRSILSAEQLEYMMEWMYSEGSLMAQMTAKGHTFFLDEGRGYASFRYDRLADDGVEVYHLEKLYVMPESQGTGLGRALFDAVVSDVLGISGGKARIELNVNRYNKAVSFYEHMGMRKSASGDFPIGRGFYMNDYIMSVDIPYCDEMSDESAVIR